jgi:hypothetical protein
MPPAMISIQPPLYPSKWFPPGNSSARRITNAAASAPLRLRVLRSPAGVKTIVLVVAILTACVARAQEPSLRIGRIDIRALDVYSNDEAKHGFFYRTADRLHVETRRAVVAQFLLFHEGDVFSAARLAETERNLRALPFLKSATVAAGAPHDGVVDVTVITQDAWSIAPETSAGNRGGASTIGASISETNLLGWGKELSIGWDKGVDRTRLALEYNDRAFFAPYWNAHFAYSHNSDGYDHRFNVRRPFYSFATPWSAELSFEGFRQDDKLYTNAVMSARFQHEHRQAIAALGRALNADDIRADRITGGLRFVGDDFFTIASRPGDPLPQTRDFRYLFARYDHLENRFMKLNYINKDMRYEDFNLGRQYSIEAAVSPRAFGAAATTGFVRAGAAEGHGLGSESFVLPSAAVQSRIGGGGFANAIASAGVQYVNRKDSEYPRVLVGRAVVYNAWRLDPETQFFADGQSGLRGYRLHAFSGSRVFLVNVEQRLYLGRELLQLYSPGIVAFVDGGNATYGGFTQLMKLKTDVGIGIRLGLPRTPRNLLRLDLAYPLNRDGSGRHGLLISFSSGQAF